MSCLSGERSAGGGGGGGGGGEILKNRQCVWGGARRVVIDFGADDGKEIEVGSSVHYA